MASILVRRAAVVSWSFWSLIIAHLDGKLSEEHAGLELGVGISDGLHSGERATCEGNLFVVRLSPEVEPA
jgi:hypothetical protein